MKKTLKILLLIFVIFFVVTFISLYYFYSITTNVKLDKNKLISFNQTIVYYDKNNTLIKEEINGKSITDIINIPEYTKNAFISIEDKRFYLHNGLDYKGLLRATFNNIKTLSFKEGASTISQQLIKNTHLSSEKTLKRKLLEIKLAKELESKYSKDEILEKYLNTIYFGNNCYGITSATNYYFDKKPEELTINESAMLAAIIKAPTIYSPFNDCKKCMERKNLVLKEMFLQNYITKNEYEENLSRDIKLSNKNAKKNIDSTFLKMVRNELDNIIKYPPYKNQYLNVYTYHDNEYQEKIDNIIANSSTNCDKSVILLNNYGQVCAYQSSCGDIPRQLGSVIKPLIAYAPAIEENKVNSLTKIEDEITDFNGYSPKNYNDKYLGSISCKKSLIVSSNVCAVKILNYVGIDNAKKYIKKLSLPLTENDNSLSLALGCFEKGITLSQITSAYTVFNNKGNYYNSSFIKMITDRNGKVLYKNRNNYTKVFEDDTVSIMNDMLKDVVKEGTAKKLSFCNQTLYAKTGTVGSKNGNTDAYSISYNKDLVLGIWFGHEDNQLLSNDITGGSEPTSVGSKIWEDIYTGKKYPTEIENSKTLEEIEIDKIAYDNDNKIILADKYTPKKYVIKALFKQNNKPLEQSTRFSFPKIEKPKISVNNKGICISLCLTKLYDAEIYRLENGKEKLVYDTQNNNKEIFIDKTIAPFKVYTYKVMPYYFDGLEKHYGNEIILEKIKSPILNIDDDWWQNEFVD